MSEAALESTPRFRLAASSSASATLGACWPGATLAGERLVQVPCIGSRVSSLERPTSSAVLTASGVALPGAMLARMSLTQTLPPVMAWQGVQVSGCSFESSGRTGASGSLAPGVQREHMWQSWHLEIQLFGWSVSQPLTGKVPTGVLGRKLPLPGAPPGAS
ncbi:MAG: hypothetical protein IPO09_01205 [Anaeromyxobacter sp.]|nr:hypothetical protein [Anaeromyxobacter sp.]